MEGRVTARWLHAPCVTIHLLRASGQRWMYDMWGLAPCHRMGTLAHVGGDLARDASGHERGNLPLKRSSSLGQ
jgi:hypothetical protein